MQPVHRGTLVHPGHVLVHSRERHGYHAPPLTDVSAAGQLSVRLRRLERSWRAVTKQFWLIFVRRTDSRMILFSFLYMQLNKLPSGYKLIIAIKLLHTVMSRKKYLVNRILRVLKPNQDYTRQMHLP